MATERIPRQRTDVGSAQRGRRTRQRNPWHALGWCGPGRLDALQAVRWSVELDGVLCVRVIALRRLWKLYRRSSQPSARRPRSANSHHRVYARNVLVHVSIVPFSGDLLARNEATIAEEVVQSLICLSVLTDPDHLRTEEQTYLQHLSGIVPDKEGCKLCQELPSDRRFGGSFRLFTTNRNAPSTMSITLQK